MKLRCLGTQIHDDSNAPYGVSMIRSMMLTNDGPRGFDDACRMLIMIMVDDFGLIMVFVIDGFWIFCDASMVSY